MSKSSFVRSLGLFDSTMLVVGCIVGAGIFRTASSIAAEVTSPALMLALWVIGGLLSLCGALCYAELAAIFPATGGDYVFIRETYGRLPAFLFGWTKLFIERTGTIAILGFVFAEYLGRVFGFGEGWLRPIAALAVLSLTAVNVAGLRWGTLVQNVFTVLKIATLGALVFVAVRAVVGGYALTPDWSFPPLESGTLQSLGVALVYVLWTYGGWTEAAYVAEEVRQPVRNVPRSIIGGVLLTTVLYLLVNWSYLLFVPVEQLPKTPLVAAAVMYKASGDAGAVFISTMIACSAFGALNGYILTGGRILYALARDHRLFAHLGTLHPERRTPALALWANGAIAAGLIFTKTFEQIMTYSTVVITVFFILAVAAVVILRRRKPREPRPYRTWGYPVTPLLFILAMIGFIIDVSIKQPEEAAFGFVLLAIGVPLYWWSETPQRHKRRR
jgi:amino acid transporter